MKRIALLFFVLCAMISPALAAFPPPEADFTSNVTQVCMYDVIQFNDTSIYSTNAPTAWWWLFGDSQDSHLQNATHYYDMPGLYTVSFRATDFWGSDWENKTAYINVTNCFSAEFTSNVTCVIGKPANVSFYGICSYPDKSHWEFGDGNDSDEYDPIYSYIDYGSYTVNHSCAQSPANILNVSKQNYILIGVNGTYCSGGEWCHNSDGGIEPTGIMLGFAGGLIAVIFLCRRRRKKGDVE